jgi:hypothetical protein
MQRAEPKALWDNSSLTLLAHRFGGQLTTAGYHIRDGLTYPTLVIDLTASTLEDGTSLEGLLEMSDARAIGAVIGKSLNAAWIHVSIIH